MRRFEFLLAFAALFAVGWPAVFGVRTRRGIVFGALFVAFLIHWRVEGVRWQLIPLYATALGLAIGDVIVIERKVDWTSRIARGLFGVAGVVLAMIPALILPVPQLPVPSGPEAIGTVTVELVDSEREEIYGATPEGLRRFPVQVWYPAAGRGGRRADALGRELGGGGAGNGRAGRIPTLLPGPDPLHDFTRRRRGSRWRRGPSPW